MIQSYAKRDLYQMILQIVLFLQTANTDDAAGRYVNTWPMVSKEYIASVEAAESKEELIVEEVKDEKEVEFDELLASSIPVNIK